MIKKRNLWKALDKNGGINLRMKLFENDNIEKSPNEIYEEFDLNKDEIINNQNDIIEKDRDYECNNRDENYGYYIKCIYHNGSSQIFTSESKSFVEVRRLYKSIKEELNKCLKKIQLYSLKNNACTVIYEKQFEVPTYHHEKALSIIDQILKQLEKFQNYFKSLDSQLSIVDKQVDILKHNIEVSDYENEEECLKFFSELKGVLSLRREIKSSININNYIDSQKSMKALKNINIKFQKDKIGEMREEMAFKMTEGMDKWRDISDKITIIPYEDEYEMCQAKKKLKKINNCIRVDNYNRYVVGFDLLYKK